MINTSNHIEDAKLVNEDINWTYIDFLNAFGFINHARLLAMLEDLEFFLDVVEIIGDYTTTPSQPSLGTTLDQRPRLQLVRNSYKETPSTHIYLSYFWNHF